MKTTDAIERFGSIRQLADALHIKPPAIYQWGEEVPPLRAYQIKEILALRASSEKQAA